MTNGDATSPVRFLPDRFSPRFLRFFGWWCREKMLEKKFFAVRLARENQNVLGDLADHDGPVLVLTNHVSWWDPLIMLTLHRMELCAKGRSRGLRAPMHIDQLERFRFFTRLGAFGIDPDEPRSMQAMVDHVARYFAEDPCPGLWINPQGRFADVREPIEMRPGAAKLAALDERTAVACVQMEYTFWLDAKPEVLLRYEPVTPDRRSTTGWLRAMREAMDRNAAALADLAIARDPANFVNLTGGEGANVHPFYGLVLKLRGKSGAIDDARDRRDRREHAQERQRQADRPAATV
ncbi:MAG: lysophospholipid acyltransferase family protein [Planctomycetota bacterium]